MRDIVLLICTILCGFFFGKYIQRVQVTRGQFFFDLQKYINLFQLNVAGRQLEVQTFNENFSQSCSKVFADFLQRGIIPNCLSKNQRKILGNFIVDCTALNSAELVKNLQYYQTLIKEECDLAVKNARSSFTFVKLGILLGVMIGILFM